MSIANKYKDAIADCKARYSCYNASMTGKRNLKYLGPLLIAVAATLWAFDGILRRSLFSLPSITIVFYEHLIGSILLLPFLWAGRKSISLSTRTAGILFIVALLSGVLGTLWFTMALQKVAFIPFSVVLLLQKLQPIFAISAAAIFLKEKISAGYIQWAALAFISAFFVTFPDGRIALSTGSEAAYAALLAVGAAFAWGSSTAFSRILLIENPAAPITALRFMYTTLFAGIWLLVTGGLVAYAEPSYSQIIRLFLIAFSTGMVALYVYYEGLKRTQAKISTIVELLFPFLAVIIDIFMYDTVLSWSQYLASGILLFSIYRVAQLNKKSL